MMRMISEVPVVMIIEVPVVMISEAQDVMIIGHLVEAISEHRVGVALV